MKEINGNTTKVCRCASGWSGDKCKTITHAVMPKISEQGYLALPTLQNAYSDLHLSIDFKPITDTGILLLTGETNDMTGDYLALILKDGFVELRLNCGTGPGHVISSNLYMQATGTI